MAPSTSTTAILTLALLTQSSLASLPSQQTASPASVHQDYPSAVISASTSFSTSSSFSVPNLIPVQTPHHSSSSPIHSSLTHNLDTSNQQACHYLPAIPAFPLPLSTSTDENDVHEYDLRDLNPSEKSPSEKLSKNKRATCASSYSPCANPSYCCRSDTVCQTDFMGNVACCPQGAACTGVVSSPLSSPASNPTGGAAGGANGGGSTVGGSFVLATTTAANGAVGGGNGGGVVVGTSTVAFVGGNSGAGGLRARGGGWEGVVLGLVGAIVGWL